MEAHSEPSEPNERDSTAEWQVAPARSLTSVAELEGRIEVALATARTAEEAALEIGAASLEAAEQARRAAALAERASASAAQAAEAAREASVRSIRTAPSALAEDEPEGSIAPVGAGSVPQSAAPVDSPPPSADPVDSPLPSADPVDSPLASADPVDSPLPGAGPADSQPPSVRPTAPSPLDVTVPTSNGRPDPFEDRITAFRLRAEKVMIRLQRIEAGAPAHEPTEVLRLSN